MRLLVDTVRTVLTLIGGVLLTLVLAPTVMVIAAVRPTSIWIERCIHLWSRGWLALAGSPLDVRGSQHIDPSSSYVVVANHRSNLDIMACFLAIAVPIRYLAKKELFRIPILAPAMRSIGIVEVDRQAPTGIHEMLNREARRLVAAGRSIIIYPEGTRSRDGSMRPFKKGAFTMAVAGELPVLPVTIHGTRRAWKPESALIHGGRITVVIDPPIPTVGMTHSDTSHLRDRVQELIEKRLAELEAQS